MLRHVRLMGRRYYADWLVNRETTCPPHVNEPPAPFVSKAAEHYRLKGMSIPDVIAQMPKPERFPRSWCEPRIELAALELRALENRLNNILSTAKPKKNGLAP